MIESLSAAVAESVTRRRRRWVVAVVALVGAAAWATSHVGFRLDIADFLPPESGASEGLAPELLARLSGSGRLAVILEADDSIPVDEASRLFEVLVPRVSALPGVRAVNARLTDAERAFTERRIPERIALYAEPGVLRVIGERLSREGIEAALLGGGGAGPERGSPRWEADPLGVIGLAAQGVRLWLGVSRVRLIDGHYALPGARAFFLTVETDEPLDDIGAARTFVTALDSVLVAARDDPATGPVLEGRRLYAVGRAVSYVGAVDLLTADGVRVTATAAGAAVLLLALFFGRMWAPVAIGATVACGLLLTGAAAWLLFGTVSVFTWVFLGLLVGLGVDYGIHVAVHLWVYGDASAGRQAALASSLARPGGGIALGAVTSAAAFLALLVIPYRWMTELALLTAFGLLAMLLCTWTVLPLLLGLSRPGARGDAGPSRWAAWLPRPGRGAPLRAAAPWAALVLASAWAATGLRFEPHPWTVALRGNPESARLDRLSREAGQAFTPLLVVSEGRTADEALSRDREAMRRLQPLALAAGVASLQSLARWLPSPEQQRANVDYIRARPERFAPERFQRDFEAVAARMDGASPYLTDTYLPEILGALDPDIDTLTLADLRAFGLGEAVDRHLLEWRGAHYAVSYVFLRQFPWAEGVATRFLDVARDAGLDELEGITVTGDALRSAEHARVIRRSVAAATLIATVLVGALLLLRFRRPALALLCLAPVACGLGAALLAMRLAGVDLTLLVIAIAPILVGIGVDDGIHVVHRLARGEAPERVLRETGAAMTLTTLTTVGAFAALALTRFEGVREVGLIGGVGLLACLVASLHLVPLGWATLEGRSRS